MNNTFNLKRFSNYLRYDLKQVWSRYYLTFIVIVCIPLITIFFTNFFSLIFNGETSFPRDTARWVIAFIATQIYVITFGARAYGYVTDKKEGTNWLMVPVSKFEKTLSIVLISGIIIPILALLCYLIMDMIVCGVFPQCGRFIFLSLSNNIGFYIFYFLGLIGSILLFVLGAMCFKKWKISLTIFISSFIFFFIAMILTTVLNSEYVNNLLGNESFIILLNDFADGNNLEHINLIFSLIVDGFVILEVLVVSALIGLRVKTLKH